MFATARESRPERPCDRNAQERAVRIWPIIHVLIEQPALGCPLLPYQPYRIDLEKESSRASLGRRFRIEHERLAERELDAVHLIRVLMEQKSQIGGCLMSRTDCEE